MKILRTAIIALFTSALLIACKKDNENLAPTPAPFSIEGKWEGTTGNGGYFGVNLKSGGNLDRFNSSGSVVASGNWELNGNTLSGNYHFLTSGTEVTFSATVNKNLGTLSGNWSNDGGEQGTMTASKK